MPRSVLALLVLAAALTLPKTGALAQIAHHPFAVGASEGAVGHQNALGAWLLGQESRFYLGLTSAVRATKNGPEGALALAGLSFAYGIFHAAGPGHGKAVVTSYMVSNEVALKRGLVIAFLAALLQGFVATAIVGIAAFLFNATAARMTAASQAIELAGYLGIVMLGLVLVWRKGRALWVVARARIAAPAPLLAASGFGGGFASVGLPRSSRFQADDGTPTWAHAAGCDCGHDHMPDPSTLGGARFDWRAAAIAVVTAGARPCSGAILVLVFALSQGIFVAGVAATFAMSIGTALTTGSLATAAVFAKGIALRFAGKGSPRAVFVGRLLEFGAAASVLLLGLSLLAAAVSGVHGGG